MFLQIQNIWRLMFSVSPPGGAHAQALTHPRGKTQTLVKLKLQTFNPYC